jgi:hypothetical protein
MKVQERSVNAPPEAPEDPRSLAERLALCSADDIEAALRRQ